MSESDIREVARVLGVDAEQLVARIEGIDPEIVSYDGTIDPDKLRSCLDRHPEATRGRRRWWRVCFWLAILLTCLALILSTSCPT